MIPYTYTIRFYLTGRIDKKYWKCNKINYANLYYDEGHVIGPCYKLHRIKLD